MVGTLVDAGFPGNLLLRIPASTERYWPCDGGNAEQEAQMVGDPVHSDLIAN